MSSDRNDETLGGLYDQIMVLALIREPKNATDQAKLESRYEEKLAEMEAILRARRRKGQQT